MTSATPGPGEAIPLTAGRIWLVPEPTGTVINDTPIFNELFHTYWPLRWIMPDHELMRDHGEIATIYRQALAPMENTRAYILAAIDEVRRENELAHTQPQKPPSEATRRPLRRSPSARGRI